MTKIVMNAKELGDADVSFISLVKRPASRLPFRVMKADNDNQNDSDRGNFMFNLSSVLKGDAIAKTSTPSVAALAIKKEDSEKLIPGLVTKGFSTDNQIEREGILILKQEQDFNESDLVAFKMDDNVVAMVSHVKKEFKPFGDSVSFAENVSRQGFLPGIFVATDALSNTFRNILFDSNSSDEVRAKMGAAISEYSNFVTKMAEALPEIVFKLEGDQTDLKVEATTQGESNDDTNTTGENSQSTGASSESDDNTSVNTSDTTEGSDVQAQAKETDSTQEVTTTGDSIQLGEGESGPDLAKKSDTAATETEQPIADNDTVQITEAMKGDIDEEILNPSVTKGEDESGAKSDTGDTVEGKGAVSKGDSEVEDSLRDLLTTIQKQLKDDMLDVTNKLDVVTKSNTELSERLNAVETVAKSAENAVNGTVLTGSDSLVRSEGLGNHSRTMKSDTTPGDDLWGETALDNIIN